jgi:hypothetical protein
MYQNMWVFKIKHNRIFRACLVACGYSQVPGVNFQEIFATVIIDVTVCILLIMMLTYNSKGKIVDIRTMFLHGNLKETIYMDKSKGMEANANEFLTIKNIIYGLVLSASEFYKKRAVFKGTPSIRVFGLNTELYLLGYTSTITS